MKNILHTFVAITILSHNLYAMEMTCSQNDTAHCHQELESNIARETALVRTIESQEEFYSKIHTFYHVTAAHQPGIKPCGEELFNNRELLLAAGIAPESESLHFLLLAQEYIVSHNTIEDARKNIIRNKINFLLPNQYGFSLYLTNPYKESHEDTLRAVILLYEKAKFIHKLNLIMNFQNILAITSYNINMHKHALQQVQDTIQALTEKVHLQDTTHKDEITNNTPGSQAAHNSGDQKNEQQVSTTSHKKSSAKKSKTSAVISAQIMKKQPSDLHTAEKRAEQSRRDKERVALEKKQQEEIAAAKNSEKKLISKKPAAQVQKTNKKNQKKNTQKDNTDIDDEEFFALVAAATLENNKINEFYHDFYNATHSIITTLQPSILQGHEIGQLQTLINQLQNVHSTIEIMHEELTKIKLANRMNENITATITQVNKAITKKQYSNIFDQLFEKATGNVHDYVYNKDYLAWIFFKQSRLEAQLSSTIKSKNSFVDHNHATCKVLFEEYLEALNLENLKTIPAEKFQQIYNKIEAVENKLLQDGIQLKWYLMIEPKLYAAIKEQYKKFDKFIDTCCAEQAATLKNEMYNFIEEHPYATDAQAKDFQTNLKQKVTLQNKFKILHILFKLHTSNGILDLSNLMYPIEKQITPISTQGLLTKDDLESLSQSIEYLYTDENHTNITIMKPVIENLFAKASIPDQADRKWKRLIENIESVFNTEYISPESESEEDNYDVLYNIEERFNEMEVYPLTPSQLADFTKIIATGIMTAEKIQNKK